jgi:metallo-beta-lactamase class B
MGLPLKHLALVVMIAAGVFVGGVLYPMWRQAVDTNRDARADPHHIAGDLYFVGSPDLASFLLLGPEGHVLIGGGDPRTARKIVDNVEQLGFSIKDVRILLATDPHMDEAGGLAALQQASGAQLWASDANADVIAAGGSDDPSIVYTPYRVMAWAGVNEYPPARVDHRVKDGDTVRLGPLALTAHITPGHAPGCTTWTFTVHDRNRDLNVVHRCGLTAPYGASLVEPERYPGIREDFERSFLTLKGLPVDIWLTSHGREYGRYRKYEESRRAYATPGDGNVPASADVKSDPVAPFVDPKGYLESLDKAEAGVRQLLSEEQEQK